MSMPSNTLPAPSVVALPASPCARRPAPVTSMADHVRPAAAGRRSSLVARRLGLLAVACALSAALPARAQDQAQPPLPTTTIQAGIHLIRAEVADQANTRAMGLMHRTGLGPNQGMLFVFPERAGHCFWMRNTRIPLTIAFIDDDGRIANLADMQPFDESSHCPLRPVGFALEMEQGWFAKHGIAPGTRLQNDRFFKAPAPAR